MARPREFNVDDAMTGAMHLFWDHGYGETSLAELLTAMKISKGSFYKAFTDKKSLYLSALDYYDDKVISATLKDLEDHTHGSGPERIIHLFKSVAASAERDGDRLGCFLCNALVDRGAHDGDVEKRLQMMVYRLEGGFRKALADQLAPVNGDWLRATARAVLASYFGLRVLGKAGLSKEMASDCVAQVQLLVMPSSEPFNVL